MQLKIQRSQRNALTGKVLFCVDIRAEYAADERTNINRYALGGQVIYNSQSARRHLEHAGAHIDRTQEGTARERASGLARGALSLAMAKMSLNVTIASLGRGHHIECKELPEMLEAEETVRNACKDLTRYLDAAATFDGSETIVEYINGEERVHIAQNAPPLLEYGASGLTAATSSSAGSNTGSRDERHIPSNAAFGKLLKQAWARFEPQVIAIARDLGITATPMMVRLATVAVGFLFLLILYEVF
jgi:hypothetical protein